MREDKKPGPMHAPTPPTEGRPRRSAAYLSVIATVSMQIASGGRSQAEDHADYKFELYAEDRGRMKIQTHGVLFENSLLSSLSLKGEYVYDAVSGATPTGGPPPAGSTQVPLARVSDVRQAGFIEPAIRWGRHTTRPQISYSLENDYESVGLSLNHAIDFNDKNTVLNLGVAQSFDTIMPKFWGTRREHKSSTDFLVGVSQILGPRTVLSANFTLGLSSGYLADPYKRVRFDGYPDPTGVFAEKRPRHKRREILHLALNHFVKPLDGAAEVSYRFYHDSFGISSHTATVSWHQKLGKHVVISPLFRFYNQTAASFYGTRFDGDPTDPEFSVPLPAFYSADYRLSALSSFTYGVSATVKIKNRVSLDVSYKRYEMIGNDRVTAASQYPKAHVISAGLRVWF